MLWCLIEFLWLSGFISAGFIFILRLRTICFYRDYVFYYNRDYAVSDSWRFDNSLILVFVPLLLMVLYIDISLCSSTFSTWYCLLAWSWWFFYWICWSLLYAYHHYMGLNAEEFAVMPRLYDTFPLLWSYIMRKVPQLWAIAVGL